MIPGFVIAILLCSGGNCEVVQTEPGTSYPSAESCKAALTAKAAMLDAIAAQRRKDGQSAATACLQEAPQPIRDVEDPYDVLETAIVHAEPNANSTYVGSVESGQRTLVTGLVTGTSWVRVLLPDGNSGFVYGNHLRKVGSRAVAAPGAPVTGEPANPAVAPPPPPPPPPVTAQAPAAAAAPAAPPGPARSAEFRDCPTCPVMVPVPGGSFTMGSSGDASELPKHRVAIAPFALGTFAVTAAEWDACAAAGGCSYKPAQAEGNAERRPMMNLSWNDATEYVQWLRKVTGKPYRLPSEAEWEYAARAGTATRYGWGEQLGSGKADCDGCGGPHDARSPADVAAFPANAWGLFGMEGGVAQWVEDCWHVSYKGAPADGAPWRSPNCARHVLRGGSWKNPPADITVSSRNFYDTSVRYLANGVRVALTQP